MVINLPVTQREYQFSPNEAPLSITDTSSHISYANAAFIRTSGFPAEELMGQPHNLTRSLSRKQRIGISQISQTVVAQPSQMTEQNAAMVEQSSVAANISEQAQHLVNAVKVFSA
jgi:methyl-accepting chemotaxis protein